MLFLWFGVVASPVDLSVGTRASLGLSCKLLRLFRVIVGNKWNCESTYVCLVQGVLLKLIFGCGYWPRAEIRTQKNSFTEVAIVIVPSGRRWGRKPHSLCRVV